MHAIASKKKQNTPHKKREPALRAVDEVVNDGETHEIPDEEDDDSNNNTPLLTQDMILQMFDGELDTYAALTSDRQQAHRNVQYIVENQVSGDFFRVRATKSSVQHRRSGSWSSSQFPLGDGAQTAEKGDDPLAALTVRAEMFRDAETAVVVMCQGIIAGLCWMDAFNLSARDRVLRSTSTNNVFACTYSAVADRSRQLFFIVLKYPFETVMCLCTTSFFPNTL
uniref:Uncharacterized protein n=1 Tax=Globisporangium ultimum (strain ATCC 200006 / CBS 805.95 / DAOM BR144) TaxID=431595 RepID=K3WI79_GLOUD